MGKILKHIRERAGQVRVGLSATGRREEVGMDAQIIPLSLGVGQVFLIRDQGAILVDCGQRNQAPAFRRALDRAGLTPQDIRLIVITHAHYDHSGSAGAIKRMTGAPLAAHRLEAVHLEAGVVTTPPAVTPLGKLVMRLGAPFSSGRNARVEPVTVDQVIGEECVRLESYGVRGQIVHTPGHTLGSVSVLLDGGAAVVGDLAMNMFPLRIGPGLPALAEDEALVRQSIRWLMNAGAQVFYPAHGDPIPAQRFQGI